MRLKSLYLQGFKSFPDKTMLTFSDGMTAIIGPNGSGKSNIADAIRWVLGEQSTKTLRGRKMEDVIFSGTQGRKPTGFCFVSLTIDNSERELNIDSDDVTITRKIYRNGDSEYRINDLNVRLKDVRELLMDTGLGKDGYCIIGQGKVADIVSAKSDERREIFEEASGISKFRYKKGEAQRKLDGTKENLLRLKDIITELEDRVEPLRKQSEKAKQFLSLSEQKKELEISLWTDTLGKTKNIIDQLGKDVIIQKNEYNDTQAVLDDIEYKIEKTFEQIQQQSVEIEQKRKDIDICEREIANKTAQIAVLNNDISHNNQDIEIIKNELESEGFSTTQYKEKIEKYTALLNEKKELIEKTKQTKIEKEKILKENNLKRSELSTKQQSFLQNKMAYDKKISEIMLSQVTSDTLIKQANIRLEEIKKSKENANNNIKLAEKEMKECEELTSVIKDVIDGLFNTKKGYEIKLKNINESVDKTKQKQSFIQEKINSLTQKKHILLDMEKNMEGFYQSVKYIIKQKEIGVLKGIYGTVAGVIKTKNEFSIAIETALGSSAQNIITADQASARNAINMLKNSKKGRATFLPLNAIDGKEFTFTGVKSCDGFVGIASDLVTYDSKYNNIITNILGRCVISTDIDTAISMSKKFNNKFKIVTLDGQVINQGGSMTGGSTSKRVGILSRQSQIFDIENEIDVLNIELKNVDQESKVVEQKLLKMTGEISVIDSQIKTKSDEHLMYSLELKGFKTSYEKEKISVENAHKEYLLAQDKIEDLTKQNNNENLSLKELRKNSNELENLIDLLTKQKQQMQTNISSLLEEISKINMDLLSLQKDFESINITKQHFESQFEEKEKMSAVKSNKLKQLEQQNKQIIQTIDEFTQIKTKLNEDIINHKKSIENTMIERNSLEQTTTSFRKTEKEKSIVKEKIAGELARIEEKQYSIQQDYDNVIAKLWDEYNMTRTDALSIAKVVDDKNKFERILYKVKSQIRGLGSVNVASIEEYKEVSQRYEFISKQVSDVEKSKDELLKMINDLTINMQKMFREKFYIIAENFSKIFTELFEGGKASLELENPDDVLQSGINIFVQPPGKIIKNLSALSGGEQAFIAIAIYFAILKVKPTPFCVLDEIEAALDEVNVIKYAKYLSNYRGKTQFITITHRRGTMENADVLYGVTMQDEGVSKMLKLDVTKAEENLVAN